MVSSHATHNLQMDTETTSNSALRGKITVDIGKHMDYLSGWDQARWVWQSSLFRYNYPLSPDL